MSDVSRKIVWKYDINSRMVRLPAGVDARVVHVDGPGLMIWGEYSLDHDHEEEVYGDDKEMHEVRQFRVFATGQPIPGGSVHLHTWRGGAFVWHLYEIMS